MRKPEILVFAGPNGSGKSTIAENVQVIGEYINADEIKKSLNCTDLEAAKKATARREWLLEQKKDFTFETVLSSRRNLDLLIKGHENGYFIKCFYILTRDSKINIQRVNVRVKQGGHSVPKEKIIQRYARCMKLVPELINICDVIHIYDNTVEPYRIYKKRKGSKQIWPSDIWSLEEIKTIIGEE